MSQGWQLEFTCRNSAVKVRPVLPGEHLAPIFRLIYDGPRMYGRKVPELAPAKTIRRPSSGASPDRGCANHEVMRYLNGPLLPAATHLKMPRLLDVVQTDQAQTMILEDVYDSSTRALRLSDLHDLAERLGQWLALDTR